MKWYPVMRKNPSTREKLYYVQKKTEGILSTDTLADEVAQRSSLTSGDVLNVFRNLKEVIVKYLVMGYNVRFNDLGVIRAMPITKGAGKKTANEVTMPDSVSSVKVSMYADRSLRKRVNDTIYWERTDAPTAASASGSASA